MKSVLEYVHIMFSQENYSSVLELNFSFFFSPLPSVRVNSWVHKVQSALCVEGGIEL